MLDYSTDVVVRRFVIASNILSSFNLFRIVSTNKTSGISIRSLTFFLHIIVNIGSSFVVLSVWITRHDELFTTTSATFRLSYCILFFIIPRRSLALLGTIITCGTGMAATIVPVLVQHLIDFQNLISIIQAKEGRALKRTAK